MFLGSDAKDGFHPFSKYARFDAEEVLDKLPDGHQIRAMFAHMIRDAYRNADLEAPPVPPVPFAMFDRRAYLLLQLEAAAAIYPGVSTGTALFELGRRVYPEFSKTMIGRAIFALAGRSFTRIADASPRAYEASVSRGEAIVRRRRPGFVHIEMRDVWDFAPFACGIWQGAMDVCNVHPTQFEVWTPSPDRLELKFTWEPD